MDLPAEGGLDATGGEVIADSAGVGDGAGSRSSFGTTRVSPARTAANAWSRPRRLRLVPVRPWSR